MHVLDPLTDRRWSELAAASPEASIFHHPAWLGLVADEYRFDVFAYGVGGARSLYAGLPVARVRSRLTGRRLVAFPFSDLCPPLRAAVAGAASVDALIAGISADVARGGPPLRIHAPVGGLGAVTMPPAYVHHRLDLRPGEEAVLRAVRSSLRRGAAKARRDGVAIRQTRDPGALDIFYRLHAATRRHQGVPTQTRRFIRRFASLFEAGLGWVLLAEREERAVAAAVFLRAGGTVTYKFGASDRAHLQHRPNNLLFEEAIAVACREGAHTLDFGRSDVSNAGLRAFKSGWGAVEVPLGYTTTAPGAGGDFAAGTSATVMRAVIRHSPATVSRAVGAALYPHVG